MWTGCLTKTVYEAYGSSRYTSLSLVCVYFMLLSFLKRCNQRLPPYRPVLDCRPALFRTTWREGSFEPIAQRPSYRRQRTGRQKGRCLLQTNKDDRQDGATQHRPDGKSGPSSTKERSWVIPCFAVRFNIYIYIYKCTCSVRKSSARWDLLPSSSVLTLVTQSLSLSFWLLKLLLVDYFSPLFDIWLFLS